LLFSPCTNYEEARIGQVKEEAREGPDGQFLAPPTDARDRGLYRG
jgi:hypothetical protein